MASHDVQGWDAWVLWPLLGLLIVTIGAICCAWPVSRPEGLGARTAGDRAREILTRAVRSREVTAEEYRQRFSR